jgi:hypothetical protein
MLSGSIPASIANLVNLEHLYVLQSGSEDRTNALTVLCLCIDTDRNVDG